MGLFDGQKEGLGPGLQQGLLLGTGPGLHSGDRTRLPNRADTTEDGLRPIAIFGDSMAAGQTQSPATGIPIPAAGVAYQWNKFSKKVVPLVAQEMMGAVNGSWFNQFAIDYNTDNPQYKICAINVASAGSVFSFDGDSNNWAIRGALYQPAVRAVKEALAYMNLGKLYKIFVHLGINDARTTSQLFDIGVDGQSFISRLQQDFPDTEIIFTMIGFSGGDATQAAIPQNVTNSRFAYVRNMIADFAFDNPNVYICANLAGFGSQNYHYDTHLTPTGCNEMGHMVNRWFRNAQYNKYVRAIICSHFDELSTARKEKIRVWFRKIGLTNYRKAETIQRYKTTIRANVFQDWRLITAPCDKGFVFTANAFITCNGSAQYLEPNNGSLITRFVQDNGLLLVKVITNRTPAATVGYLSGYRDATPTIFASIAQFASGLNYRLNATTATTYATDTKIQNNVRYGVLRRDSLQHSLVKDGVIVHTASVASTGVAKSAYVGGEQNNGAFQNKLDSDVEDYSKWAGDVDVALINAAMDELNSGW